MRIPKLSALVLLPFLLLAISCTQPAPEQFPVATATATARSTPRPPGPPGPTATATAPRICIETVVIQDGKFIPDRLTVPRNCVLLFSNRGDTIEQIQGHDFLLGEMGRDQSWAHTYRDPGTFEFRSTKNSALRGTVTVLP